MDAQYKKLIYDKANIAVAKALNHKKMGDSDAKIEKLKNKIVELEAKLENAKTSKQQEAAKKAIETASTKLEEATNNISLSTSKVNYLDPRISISWAKKGEVPIEKIYNKTQLQKFVWAMDTSSKFEF
jgi:DNA topoisomerase-1